MKKPFLLHFNIFLLFIFCFETSVLSWSQSNQFNQAKNYEGASDLVDLGYHMGPVLASPINLYIIWYGHWNPYQQTIIRDFIDSVSSSAPHPSAADWWRTVRLYYDQTGSNITGSITLSGEFYDSNYSQGKYLNRLSMQYIIKNAVNSHPRALPLNPHNGLYLILTSSDVGEEEFCRAICGFHFFTFPHIVGVTVPFAWVGNSGTQCPGMCAYPFALPNYPGRPPPSPNGGSSLMLAPNGDVGVDGMISVIGHELAEVSSNPLVNAWYAGDDPTAPTEIADLCLGVYGTGAGSGYAGQVYKDSRGNGFNVNGVKGRKFLVQWVWHPLRRRCFGPNAMD